MAVSEKEYYNLTVSISKALNNVEMPLKNKHARAAIIGTFHSGGAHSFWAIVIRQPLQENRIVAWKFCHLLHKVLRSGHVHCVRHSFRHKPMINELGKLWGHLTDGYGNCIKNYTTFLSSKLLFHERNPHFPGNLQLKRSGDLERIGGNDINYYFQLCVEMFDYLDDIITLETAIFSSVQMYRVNSMTPSGQCRLGPLIPCIQDSNQLYDFVVRIMFKLHKHLPNELLGGHRERFRTIFEQLKKFYTQSSSLQYFVDLIQVPVLPTNAPNFSSQVDFGAYTPPVVVIPEPETIVENLIDTTEPIVVPTESVQSTSAPNDLHSRIKERDELIKHLQLELERVTKYLKTSANQFREEQSKHEEEVATLNFELSQIREELTNMRIEKEELDLKVQTAPSLELKALAEEERAKTTEEKFQKLKTMYTQIRDEHVKLLRKHGEVSKQLAVSTKTATEAVNKKEEISSQLEELQKIQSKADEALQQSSEQQIIFEVQKSDLNTIKEEKLQLQNQLEELEANKSAEIAELCISLDNIKKQLEEVEIEKNTLTNNENLMSEKIDEFEMKYKTALIKTDELETKNLNVNKKLEVVENDLQKVKSSTKILLQTCIKSSEKLTSHAVTENELSSTAGTPAYFMIISDELNNSLTKLINVHEKYTSDDKLIDEFADTIIVGGHLLASVYIQGTAICNTSANIESGERISDQIKNWSQSVKSMFESFLNENVTNSEVKSKTESVQIQLQELNILIGGLSSNLNTSDQLSDLVDEELSGMDKAINEAALKIEEMLLSSRASDSGIKLEVNEKILDACTNLMQCIRILVQKSRLVQAEIISMGKGSASVKEFYKRNHQWTEGLISAAKSVAQGANFLLTAANKAVAGDSKHQLDLVVAAQEIAASTAQLVVASRVKAPRGSENLKALGTASKNVTQATGAVVATAKDSSNRLEDSQDMDLIKLSVHQAKTLDMEMQVKVLELEQALQTERLRLAAFRRKNYQSSDGDNKK